MEINTVLAYNTLKTETLIKVTINKTIFKEKELIFGKMGPFTKDNSVKENETGKEYGNLHKINRLRSMKELMLMIRKTVMEFIDFRMDNTTKARLKMTKNTVLARLICKMARL